jgi:3-oxoacyl-(acyl-carrier-protein) synthase
MRIALRAAGLDASAIDYISAHGTGTPANDISEATAMASVFGADLERVPVSSIKSMLGHCMGAANAIEAAMCALAIRDQRIPPTINTEACDARFPVQFDVVPHESRAHRVRHVMSNAFAFGGCTSSIIMSQVDSNTEVARKP